MTKTIHKIYCVGIIGISKLFLYLLWGMTASSCHLVLKNTITEPQMLHAFTEPSTLKAGKQGQITNYIGVGEGGFGGRLQP